MTSHPVSVSASSGADSIGYRAPHRYRPNPIHDIIHNLMTSNTFCWPPHQGQSSRLVKSDITQTPTEIMLNSFESLFIQLRAS
jgi:hypothetical protein